MDRLESYSPALKTTVLYLANPKTSFSALGKQFGISKQAAQKRVKIGEGVLKQTEVNNDLSQKHDRIAALQQENKKQAELIAHLRRELILKSAAMFMLTCFKERVKKFFPNFSLKRLETYEKKISSRDVAKVSKNRRETKRFLPSNSKI